MAIIDPDQLAVTGLRFPHKHLMCLPYAHWICNVDQASVILPFSTQLPTIHIFHRSPKPTTCRDITAKVQLSTGHHVEPRTLVAVTRSRRPASGDQESCTWTMSLFGPLSMDLRAYKRFLVSRGAVLELFGTRFADG
ncbi:hypothetical protein FRC03_007866 [Tulasnella sp. 419]|nr:hypothetical protein FRC03_007866 [Tulasnella sp. 419]